MLYNVPVEIEEEQKPKAKPKRKKKRRSTLGCHICQGHNSTKNSKRSINPAVKQAATTTTTTKQKSVTHFRSCRQRIQSQAKMLSRRDKEIKEKDLEIKQKNKEITRLTGYKRRAEEADDKAFLKQQKFKQELKHQRSMHSTLIEKKKTIF